MYGCNASCVILIGKGWLRLKGQGGWLGCGMVGVVKAFGYIVGRLVLIGCDRPHTSALTQ